MPDFGDHVPEGLKSFSRAFFEMKYRPTSGYVRNFNLMTTPQEKLRFLLERGRIGDGENLTDQQIEERLDMSTRTATRV